MAALKKQLEEVRRLRDQLKKPEFKLRKTKPKLRRKEMRPSSTVTTSA